MQEIVRRMWVHNHLPENWLIKKYAPTKRSEKDPNVWGFGVSRRLLQVAYTISLLCLLRFDEVLKIQMQDIEFMDNMRCIKITLPFRKTHQGGGEYFCASFTH